MNNQIFANMRTKMFCSLLFIFFQMIGIFAQAQPIVTCETLTNLRLPDTTINSAIVVPAEDGLPEYCDVFATTSSTIVVNVRMPIVWNGKMYFGGNRGFAGHVRFNTADGLVRNYATVSTDTGHVILNPDLDILDGSWALNNPQAEVDYGHRAVHRSTIIGKKIIKAYYGSSPKYSYFDGCSNGGRQALQEAIRHPEEYDGIIAGAPVLDFTGAVTSYAWNMQAMHVTESSSDIPSEKLPVIGNAVLASCDAMDGLVDGQIDDPRICTFDPSSLLCPAADAPDCLTQAQVDALTKIYNGPEDSRSNRLYPGLPVGGETPDSSFNGWDFYLVNIEDFGPAIDYITADQFLRYLAFDPDEPDFDLISFNFDTDPQRMKRAARILNATSTDLRDFQKAGGKLLMFQGWSDAAVSAVRTVDYFEKVRERIGTNKTDKFARLFMAPGMFHCDGGPGPNSFDALGALEQWVEQRQAPASLNATHFNDNTGEPDRTRPLCPYPQAAKYNGSGDINDAANFHCE